MRKLRRRYRRKPRPRKCSETTKNLWGSSEAVKWLQSEWVLRVFTWLRDIFNVINACPVSTWEGNMFWLFFCCFSCHVNFNCKLILIKSTCFRNKVEFAKYFMDAKINLKILNNSWLWNPSCQIRFHQNSSWLFIETKA